MPLQAARKRICSLWPRVRTTFLYRHLLRSTSTVTPRTQVQLSLLSENELSSLLDVWPVHLDEMRSRLRRGDQCYTVRVEDKIVHYSWVQSVGTHWIMPAAMSVSLRPNDLWIYHCRTAETHRGKRIYPFVLTQILADYRQLQFSNAWIYTDSKNAPSQRGIELAGFHLERRLRALEIRSSTLPLSRSH